MSATRRPTVANVPIAIVGLSGRFPGAADVPAFWRNLCAGVESISHFALEELEDAFSPAVRAGKNFVAARPILDGVDRFDAGFFGMLAREAELTDPQHRVFLECCWEALEDGGCDPSRFAGAIGVIAGCSINTYFLHHVLRDRALIEQFTSDYQVGSYPMLLGAGQDFLATRVAYKLNLRGPSMTVQSACSTSLLAVAQACENLMLGHADMMLAGGVSISFPQKRGFLYQDGGMVSPDGHCRTFDAQANGTVFGAGAGAVLLKRLDDAVADGDSIYAVIRGFGINNDGSEKVGYTAPTIEGQAAAIAAAHAMANVDPRSVHYIECHGTATPLGDPIEFSGLVKAFRGAGDERGYCALGSAKANIGHVDIAAGVTGLIKTALVVRDGKIPPMLHFTAPNPRMDLASSPFYVNTKLEDWSTAGEPRRAGVSSFGVGGTNVHLVLEQAPERRASEALLPRQLLVLSARSEAALGAARTRLAEHLRANEGAERLADVAYTLQVGRREFAHRSVLSATSSVEALAKLERPSGVTAGRTSDADPAVVFMFPGQGSQYVDMGRDLYDALPPFREAIDRCAAILEPIIGQDLRALLYPVVRDAAAESPLTATVLAQPAIFAVEYALAGSWMHWGITPAAMIGHSVGEFVAAHLAGVFSLEDALMLVAARGRLMQGLPGGAMLAVRLPEGELAPLLEPQLGLAALNAPALSVVAGPFEAVAALEARLNERGAMFRRLHTSHAFHSPMMDPVIEPLRELIASVPLSSPQLPYISGVSGDWVTEEEATSPEYWARHCREPVRFADGLATLIAGGATALLEVGAGSALATFALQGAAKGSSCTIAGSLPSNARETGDLEAMLESLGRLWIAGITPDWQALHDGTARRISLPTYPFERARHWIEAPQPKVNPSLAAPPQMLPAAVASAVLSPAPETTQLMSQPVAQSANGTSPSAARRASLQSELVAMLEDLSGETIGEADLETSFLELGFDSLFLGRFVQQLQARYGVEVTFRQLLGDIPSVAALTDRVLIDLPPEIAAPAPVTPAVVESAPVVAAAAPVAAAVPVAAPVPSFSLPAAPAAASSIIESVVRDQLQAMQQLMREQLQALQGHGPAVVQAAPAPAVTAAPVPIAPAVAAAAAPPAHAPKKEVVVADDRPSRFNVYKPGAASASSDLTPEQQAHIDALIARTAARTARSKQMTQDHRKVLADPRAAGGFRAEWKEMVYPITCVRAHGSKIWDVDGNEYVDVVNGFGQTFFGHAPDFVVDAVGEQLKRGFAIGPQTDLAGEAAELFSELTGNERVTFCNTGSEAVMAALRVARTVTGRNKVVVFNGAYHGQFDEVLVKGARTSLRSLPVAPGIPAESVANMTVLPYGTPETLEWIREHASELAAVVVEPVQSRHPELQPKEFLKELRAITEASGSAFVFDEVVTGFRMHPAGMQAVFDIRADLATYGKVVGGGLPIGILAGKPRFMDALDGGMWQYGDDSVPEVPPTFFAGTFVRHPLVMAAVLAVLRYIKEHGPALQEALTVRTTGLVARLNAEFARRGLSSHIESFGSMFYFSLAHDDKLASLLYYHLRNRGVYISEGFPCFLTTAHSEADVEHIFEAFVESLNDLQSVGILCPAGATVPAPVVKSALPPAPSEVAPTEEQTEIWLAAQLSDEASCAFNESVTLKLTGTLNEAAFNATWREIVARHDALRASFSATGELMRIAPELNLTFALSDLSDRPAEAPAALEAIVDRDARTPFDLVNGPLVRGHLVHLAPDSFAFVLTSHHIVCDGWSVNVILNEFAQLYAAACKGEKLELPAPYGFARYAQAQHDRDPAEHAKVEAYWLAQFQEPVRPLELPTDRPRGSLRSFSGATRSTSIDQTLYRSVKKAGARQGCTLFVTLLTAFQALMGRFADQNDVVVGVPTAGQSLLDGEIVVGHCVDFLPIRANWNADTKLSELLASLKKRVLDAYEHQSYTFGTIVRKLELAREANRLPLAEIQFNLERLSERLELPGLSVEVEPNPKAFVNFDLFLNIIESEHGLRLDCDYNTDLFDAATIDRWLGYYRTLLEALVADATQNVNRLSYLPAAEREHVVLDVNRTARDYPHGKCLHTLFEAQVAARPGATAAAFEESELTYEQLDRKANRLANHLRARTGGPRKLVGILLDRSLDMLVALLATHKAGCAYVPLDPSHPAARLRSILSEAQVAAVVLDDDRNLGLVPEGTPVVHLGRDASAIGRESDAAPAAGMTARDLAYVIYTSGSTGTPKGVEIEHRALVNFLTSMAEAPGLVLDDVLLAVTTISFDIAGLELFLPLSVGAKVVIAGRDEVADGFRLLGRIQSSGATAMQATPATWRLLLEAGFRPGRGFKMLCGGEPLSRDLADRLLESDGELWNMYGPTETTIWSSCAHVVADDAPITVGRPIANTQFYVLDPQDQPVSVGMLGQLHIGGDGVARGYVKRPELTAEKFVLNPFVEGRMYRTGDLARLLPNGEFQVIGRIDHQVKLRGFRIELGEIESVLTKHAGVAAAAAVLREDVPGDARLVVYFVERPNAPQSPAALSAALGQYVPEYMIPSAWVRLDTLPLSANGKIDRKALPAPDVTAAAAAEEFEAPRTPTEVALAKIWAEVLHLERIGIKDDLFKLGADSIHLFKITARANKQGIRLAAKQLLQHRSIADLAATLEASEAAATDPNRVLPLSSLGRFRRPVLSFDAVQNGSSAG
ncbi:MAG: amino acid adenylation domain-containing protein [Vulcanimicrobiaceae bacterium]